MAGSLAIDNVTVTDTSTHAKEVKGSKCTLLFTHNAAITTAADLFAGEVQTVFVKGTVGKSMVMPRDGSVTGLIAFYNVTIQTSSLAVRVIRNGVVVFVGALNNTVGEHTFTMTKARGIDAFSADDGIGAQIVDADGGSIANIIVAVEVMLDD